MAKRMPESKSNEPFCNAVGVYRWPFDEADVRRDCREMSGKVTAEGLGHTRTQLENLVVVELLVTSPPPENFLNALSQSKPDVMDDESQVPYDESYWTADGTQRLDDPDPPQELPYRIVFFLHFFDLKSPLYAGDAGTIELPKVADLPSRLRDHLEYLPP
jgi:hypothetical protein